MSAANVIGFLHFLSLFLLVAGLTAVMFPLYWAWGSRTLQQQRTAFEVASLGQSPPMAGAFLAGITGVSWAVERGYNLVTTGWLLAVELLHVFILLVCIPVIGLSLQRVRVYSLEAERRGEMTSELRDLLADNVPLVFGTVIIMLVPLIAWLAVFKPF